MPKFKIPIEKREFARDQRAALTAGERAFWHASRRQQIDSLKFRRQVPIGGFIADFCCFEARLIIEIDGVTHERAARSEQDARRDVALRAHGFDVLRFSDEAVMGNVDVVIAAILRFLAQRKAQ